MLVFTVRTLVSGRAVDVELNDSDTVAVLRRRAEAALGLERRHRVLCGAVAVRDAELVSSLRSHVVLLVPVAEKPKHGDAATSGPGASQLTAPRAYAPPAVAQPETTVAQQVLEAVELDVLDAAQHPPPADAGICERAEPDEVDTEPAERQAKRAKPPTRKKELLHWWDDPNLAALSLPPELEPVVQLFSRVAAVAAFLQAQRLVATCTMVASTLLCSPTSLAEQLRAMNALAPGLVCLRERQPAGHEEDASDAALDTSSPELAICLYDPARVGNIRVAPAQDEHLAAPAEGEKGSLLLQPGRPSVDLGGEASAPSGRSWDVLTEGSSERLLARQAAAFRGCCLVAARDAHQAAVAAVASCEYPGVGLQYDAVVQGKWHDTIGVPTLSAAIAAATNHAASAAVAPSPRRQSRAKQHGEVTYRCRSTSALDVSAFLAHLQSPHGLGCRGQVAHIEHLPSRLARTAALPAHAQLPGHVLGALSRQGVASLYTHQAVAIQAAMEGRHVVVSTSTASGKSVCFLAPLLARLHSDADKCALLLFPTKALAQDQLRALHLFTAFPFPDPPLPGIYDGDTPMAERGHLREHARILFSNPDMLHCSVLPNHASFARFLSRLAFVVIDEAHAYKGAFGCHTALVLRRLRRLAERHGSAPQFIFCSATIANPVQHAANLAGLAEDDVVSVSDDGSPRGPKEFVLWNPPVRGSAPVGSKGGAEGGEAANAAPRRRAASRAPGTRGKAAIAAALLGQQGTACLEHNGPDAAPHGLTRPRAASAAERPRDKSGPHRASPIFEVAALLAECVQHGLSCLAFCKTRKLSELVLLYAKEVLSDTDPGMVSKLAAYRSGYTPEARRAIEHGLSSGTLKGVAATNALELGIDVGSLDVTLHLGFPGGISSLWQQAGRAGRREQRALSIYVAFDGPVDQCLFARPAALFSRPPEAVAVDASNPRVLAAHASCAAHEAPLTVAHDARWFGPGLEAAVEALRQRAVLGVAPHCAHLVAHGAAKAWSYIGPDAGGPSRGISLRSVEERVWRVLDTSSKAVIEEIEASKAFFIVYEGAIVMNQARTWLCTKLELGERVAHVHPVDAGYYTAVIDNTTVTPHAGQAGSAAYPAVGDPGTACAHVATCTVCTRYTGFTKRWRSTGVVFDSLPLFLPEAAFDSVATWVRVPDTVRQLLGNDEQRVQEGMHAAAHALTAVLPLHVSCDGSGDIATECGALAMLDGRPRPLRLLLYDRLAGGSGIAQQAARVFGDVVWAALGLVESCGCEKGCLSCVHDLSCTGHNNCLDKAAAAVVLRCVWETLCPPVQKSAQA